jgi:hypothetical protein
VKSRIVEACAATVQADRQVTPDEAELVRVVAASLGVPVPPVLTGPGASGGISSAGSRSPG